MKKKKTHCQRTKKNIAKNSINEEHTVVYSHQLAEELFKHFPIYEQLVWCVPPLNFRGT